ncbi:hypothetical protein MKJ04_21490 [Pontibacter sp. E15-1]|uniref:hypothetical protein n=1 Tax=Pontibacter sp. E15-1 TaxID=2919918 RepID=UPI001F4FACD9|nr:hypothetical protein [Pontibacter sp. E15-1]MCJ8167429.1 hypothetical protein [Pontibacter sp. E15-1]
MEDLTRLVKLIQKRGNKSNPFVNLQDEKSNETRLFKLIEQGEVDTDEEAARALYGSNKVDANYRMLKSRIRKKLLRQLNFIELPKDKFIHSNVQACEVDTVILEAQILITANEYKIAEKVLNQALETAKADELNKRIVRCLELKQVINSIIGSDKAFTKTEVELQKYYTLEAKERLAVMLYQSASVALKSNMKTRNEWLGKLPAILQELQKLWQESSSSSIFNMYNILNISYLELCGDYSTIAGAVETAENLLRDGVIHPGWYNKKYNSFIRVYALLRTKKYDQGLVLAVEYAKLFDPLSVNWFAFMENYLLLALHARKYALAGEIMREVMENRFLSIIQQPAKERWELFRRHLVLISNAMPAQLQMELPNDVFTQLVELPKDKAGFNLSLFILNIIDSFAVQDDFNFEQQAERIRKYVLKYMRGEKAERPRYFLRLLLLAIHNDLDEVRTKAASKNLFAKLSNTPAPGDAFAEVEIIPYEHLWETVLSILRKRTVS